MPVFHTRNFELAGGGVLADLHIAYECYGEMTPDHGNVILVTHGITSSHHAAGPATPDRRKGWYDALIGPGKLFDTGRYCIVSPNMPGSCYGSTGPASTDPATGRPYGARFPAVCLEDIVRSQHLLLQSLGVQRLMAVAGASIGGYQAFQWAVSFPGFMRGVIATDTAPWSPFDGAATLTALTDRLSADPGWNGGEYRAGAMEEVLTAIRAETLKSYGFEAQLDAALAPEVRARMVREEARNWAREFDAHSLIAVHRAVARFDVSEDLHRIRARLLYVLADTDAWFPASIGRAVMARLSQAGVDAEFLELQSRHGHYATMMEPEKWVPAAETFLRGLAADG